MIEPSSPPPDPTSAPATAPAGRRGHWSLHLLGLAVSAAGGLWCVHWLSQADLSAHTARYTWALVLLLPASGGLCFFGSNVVRRGRWLLWLAGLLWAAAAVVLAGVYGVLTTLEAATPQRTTLLALGVGLSGAASYFAFRLLRRTRR